MILAENILMFVFSLAMKKTKQNMIGCERETITIYSLFLSIINWNSYLRIYIDSIRK